MIEEGKAAKAQCVNISEGSVAVKWNIKILMHVFSLMKSL